ncbi:hypothetical protein DRJ17_01385 [Candidatus Woesearchaeota archaeon]|mgnify:CR=1 FL=1|nr:MAG: hypothetical protein DRJ17_01385 [Candidatus Woesearchaeota archaeon]
MAKLLPEEEHARLFSGGRMPPPIAPEPEERPGLFEKKNPQPQPNFRNDILDLTRRMRMIEEQYSNLRRRMQLFEQSTIQNDKKLHENLRLTNADIEDIKQELHDIKQNIHLLIKEIENTVRLDDYKVLQRYIEMWQPVKFVTHDEVLKIIDEKLQQFKEEKA